MTKPAFIWNTDRRNIRSNARPGRYEAAVARSFVAHWLIEQRNAGRQLVRIPPCHISALGGYASSNGDTMTRYE